MGYSIRYDVRGGERRTVRRHHPSLLWSVAAAACGALVWYGLWHSGILHLLDALAQAIGNGAPLGETFSAFCLEVLKHAQAQ